MIQFDILTLFPGLLDSYLNESLISKAQAKKLVKIGVHNLRQWTKDKHHTADDKPFGGGLGMVMKIDPIYKGVQKVKKKKGSSRVVLFTPRGKMFTQKEAHRMSKYDQLIFICGRYEGVDERVAKHVADEELSIGNYVLMGGEVPAMVVMETICRLIPGVIGKEAFLQERMGPGQRGKKTKGFIEYPQYTRPEAFEPKKGTAWKVPPVLMSGDHKKIEEWKREHGKVIE